MRAASTAEWILSRVTTTDRAASIVGDLVETEMPNGLFCFWLSTARIAIRLSWRRTLGFVAAFYALGWTLYAFDLAIHGIHAAHRPRDSSWGIIFDILGVACSILCAVSIYASVRYGLGERTTQMTLAWTGIFTLAIFFWWHVAVLVVCIAAALFLASVSLIDRDSRKQALVILVAVAVGCAARILMSALIGLYQHVLFRGPWGDREMRQHPSFGWFTFFAMVLCLWALTAAWSRMHDRLMRGQALDARREML